MSLQIELLTVGMFQSNCIIVYDDATSEALVVDPGDEDQRILQLLADRGATPDRVLLTHAHIDHVGAVREVAEATGAEILLHEDDREVYEALPMQASFFGCDLGEPRPVDRWLKGGDTLTFAGHTIRVIHTPGHSPGSVCFLLEADPPVLFSGDTLFKLGIGRTDLWGGDHAQIMRSLRQKVAVLEGETLVYPGHGPRTTIAAERATNPFLL